MRPPKNQPSSAGRIVQPTKSTSFSQPASISSGRGGGGNRRGRGASQIYSSRGGVKNIDQIDTTNLNKSNDDGASQDTYSKPF
jgi:hypothetical protein